MKLYKSDIVNLVEKFVNDYHLDKTHIIIAGAAALVIKGYAEWSDSVIIIFHDKAYGGAQPRTGWISSPYGGYFENSDGYAGIELLESNEKFLEEWKYTYVSEDYLLIQSPMRALKYEKSYVNNALTEALRILSISGPDINKHDSFILGYLTALINIKNDIISDIEIKMLSALESAISQHIIE